MAMGVSFMGAELRRFVRAEAVSYIRSKAACAYDYWRNKYSHQQIFTLATPHTGRYNLVGCNDVVISGITLLNSLKVRNSDGIDLDHSKNVRIS